jgi:hypothetical protein
VTQETNLTITATARTLSLAWNILISEFLFSSLVFKALCYKRVGRGFETR